jgi:hypothetical protein
MPTSSWPRTAAFFVAQVARLLPEERRWLAELATARGNRRTLTERERRCYAASTRADLLPPLTPSILGGLEMIHGHALPIGSSCGCCVSRRRFLAGCAACAAGAAGLSGWPARAPAGETKDRVPIRLVFSHCLPEEITWPNIGYDYETHKRQVLAQLQQACPQIEFLPIWARTAEDAEQIFRADKEVRGYILYFAGMKGSGSQLLPKLGQAQRPTVVIDHLYAGTGNYFGALRAIRQAGFPMVPLSSSRFTDVIDVVRCFEVLKKPGATLRDFFTSADAARCKNIGAPGDLTCKPDKLELAPISQVLKQLKASKILLVGREPGAPAKGIFNEFGVTVLSVKFPELHEAWLRAKPEAAARFADDWMGRAEQIIEPKRDEIVKSGAMYAAMQEVMKKHDARAVTINCLGGFYGGHLQAFPCLGFCDFNDRGLVGACEGDLLSTITMLAVGLLTNRPGFISDPVFDTSKNQIIYAHCVAPTKVFGPSGPSNPYHIRNHSEDRKGAAIRSLLPLGYLTSSLKFIPGRKECVFHRAKAVENVDEDMACRTKLAGEVKGDIDKLMRGWDHGWHRVTFYGDLLEPVSELCKALDITLTEEA